MPETSETPEEPQQGPPSIEEGPKRRPTGTESTPGGVGAPLGTETYETRPLPALDALLQTSFLDELPPVKGLKDLQPHAESHEPMGDDYIMALGEVMFLDHYIREYTKAGMTDAAGDTILFSLSVSNAKLEFGWGKAKRMGGRTFKESTEFPDAGLWDSVFMGITKSHTGTPAVQPDMDNSNVSNLYLKAHDITEVRRLEFTDTDQAAGNNISLQQRGDAAGAILEVVNDNDATQYSSPTYRRLRLADPVGADDAATKRYVDALSYAGHALLDSSLHTDTDAQAVVEGSLVIGNAVPSWDELPISVPAANVRNVLGVDNGETTPSWKAALDATNPVNAGGAAAPGTSLIFSHRDHVHAVAASHSGSAHHAEAHVLATTGPHTGTLPWGDLNKTGSSIADLATRAHASLSDAPADAHHVAFVKGDADALYDVLGGLAAHAGDDDAHHDPVTIGADAAHSLAAQVLSAVLAANGQTGHMSGAMFDKLDGIEATADVTDATNVAGAGAVMDSDIAPGEGFLRKTGAGAYTAHKSNLAAAAAPVAADDDADAGYSVGSVWIDTTNDNMYICVDSTNGAAVWRHLNAAAAAHDHTGAADGGVLTNDEHDGYSEYDEIAAPAAPAADKAKLYVADDSGVTRPYVKDADGDVAELAGYTLLGSVTLGAAAQTLASFTNIPAKFRNLRLVWHGASDTAADIARDIGLQFNADGGGNYNNQIYLDAAGFQNIGATSLGVGVINGALLAYPTWGVVDIINYADSTWRRVVTAQGGYIIAGGVVLVRACGMWQNAADAINRVDILSTNAATKFETGSVAFLYGC